MNKSHIKVLLKYISVIVITILDLLVSFFGFITILELIDYKPFTFEGVVYNSKVLSLFLSVLFVFFKLTLLAQSRKASY